ncbi:MAG: DUF1311 domain-containing protein [Alphaproteobacteria bacterium]|nr:DUF1311 domain-containing protein [Alphaproteobacteria bacterium]
MRYFFILLFFVLSFAPFSYAEDHKFPCDRNMTQTDLNICSGEEMKYTDQNLKETYQQALEKLEGDYFLQKKEQFLSSQKEWEEYREAACKFENPDEGSIAPLIYANCRIRLTQERVETIKSGFMEW